MGASHMPNSVNVSITSTLNSTPLAQPPTHESQEQGKMEVDHPAALHLVGEDKKDTRTSDVRDEIEQRWHQVETIPLREEKQVPITTALGNSVNSDRLPANELAALLDKEVRLPKSVIHIILMIVLDILSNSYFMYLLSWDTSRRSWTDSRGRTTF